MNWSEFTLQLRKKIHESIHEIVFREAFGGHGYQKYLDVKALLDSGEEPVLKYRQWKVVYRIAISYAIVKRLVNLDESILSGDAQINPMLFLKLNERQREIITKAKLVKPTYNQLGDFNLPTADTIERIFKPKDGRGPNTTARPYYSLLYSLRFDTDEQIKREAPELVEYATSIQSVVSGFKVSTQKKAPQSKDIDTANTLRASENSRADENKQQLNSEQERNWKRYLSEENQSLYYNSFGLEEWSHPEDETYFISGLEFHPNYTMTFYYAYHARSSKPSSKKRKKVKVHISFGRFNQVHGHVDEKEFKAYFIFQAIGHESEEFFKYSYTSTEQSKGEAFSGVGIAVREGASVFGKKRLRPIQPQQRWLPSLVDFGVPKEFEYMIKGMGYPLMTSQANYSNRVPEDKLRSMGYPRIPSRNTKPNVNEIKVRPSDLTIKNLHDLARNEGPDRAIIANKLKGWYLVIGVEEHTDDDHPTFYLSKFYVENGIIHFHHIPTVGEAHREVYATGYHFRDDAYSLQLFDSDPASKYAAAAFMNLKAVGVSDYFSIAFAAVEENHLFAITSLGLVVGENSKFTGAWKALNDIESIPVVRDMTAEELKSQLQLPYFLSAYVFQDFKKPLIAPQLLTISAFFSEVIKIEDMNSFQDALAQLVSNKRGRLS